MRGGFFVRSRRGDLIGSGGKEAGCKTVIGGRDKQPGMCGSESGAENILALRYLHSRRLEDFWQSRLKEHAARNNTLPLAAGMKNFVSHPGG